MYVLRLAKAAILPLVFLGLNPAFASELISLGELEEINANTRLEFNFKAHEPKGLLPMEAVNTSPSKLDDLRKKFLHRDLGPLSFKLNIYNPLQLSRNNLSVNLDLVKSYDLLRENMSSRSPFDLAAVSLL